MGNDRRNELSSAQPKYGCAKVARAESMVDTGIKPQIRPTGILRFIVRRSCPKQPILLDLRLCHVRNWYLLFGKVAD